MSSSQNGSNIPWWAIILGFIFFWPVGLILLFLNLGGVSIPVGKKAPTGQQTAGPAGAASSASGPSQQQKAPSGDSRAASHSNSYGSPTPPKKQKKTAKKDRGRILTRWGVIISFLFFLDAADSFAEAGGMFSSSMIVPLCFLALGMVMLGMGAFQTARWRRQQLYLGVIGQQRSVFLSDLAGSVHRSEKRVVADLEKMLSDGVLPMGYIDRASGRLVLSDEGYQHPREEPRPADTEKAETAKQASDDDVLRQIRTVNDSIRDPEMSRKIDRIGEITGKILDYQRKEPAKAQQLRQFLNYYLPTTLKLLRAYAQMEAQGVEGENISAAKARIEGMMDKVVEGFEKQLDQLFQAQAMDIATDVDVLERMLEKDGLGSGMTLGS